MAITVQQIHPMAHLPLVLGVLWHLEVATVIYSMIPPHLAHVLSSGRGVEAVVLAILYGHYALYKVGARLEKSCNVVSASAGVNACLALRIPRRSARCGSRNPNALLPWRC